MSLVKTQSVLRLVQFDRRRAFFAPTPEEPGYPRPEVYIGAHQYEDMGSPTQITITIEPGDTLNGENA